MQKAASSEPLHLPKSRNSGGAERAINPASGEARGCEDTACAEMCLQTTSWTD